MYEARQNFHERYSDSRICKGTIFLARARDPARGKLTAKAGCGGLDFYRLAVDDVTRHILRVLSLHVTVIRDHLVAGSINIDYSTSASHLLETPGRL